jgi:DNA-binding NarL/FixJ family response regulator
MEGWMSIRVLLVDDSAAHLELIRMLLDLEDDFTVVGEAPDGEAGIQVARDLAPDLIVSDIEMPRLDGLHAVPGYRAAAPDAVVVLMSSRTPSDARPAALSAGADLYLDKGTGVETIIDELRQAAEDARARSYAQAPRTRAAGG